MLHPAISSFVLTSLVCIYDIANEERRKITGYLFIFLLLLSFMFAVRAESSEIFQADYMINPGDEDYIKPEWSVARKCREHGYYMHKFYREAEQITWFLPEYDDIEKAKICFSTAVATAVPPHNITKIIAIAVGLFTKYGLDCIDRYSEVSHKLNRSIYHADMYLFYLDMLPNDCCLPKGYVVIHRHEDDEQNE